MEKNQPENQHLLEKTTSFKDVAPNLAADDATVPDAAVVVDTDIVVKSAEKLKDPEEEKDHDQEKEKEKDQDQEKEKEEEDDEKEKEEDEKKEEEESKDEPVLHYNLNTILEVVDQFLSTPHDSRDQEEDSAVDIPKFIDKFMDLVNAKIEQYDNDAKEKESQVSEDESTFLEAVDRLWKLKCAINKMKLEEKKNLLVNRIGSTQQEAISYLEEEFRFFLEESRSDSDPAAEAKGKKEPDRCVLPDAESDQLQFPGYSDEIVSYLNKIVNQMISGGFESECCQVYIVARRNIFEGALQKLGFEKHSIDDIQKMNWESMEREIATWIQTFKQCATVLFPGERNLAESVFSAYPPIYASLFSNLTRGIVIQLLNFSEGVAMTKRSAEKLFKLLDMYEALRDTVPKMENLFPEESANELKTETTTARTRLGEAAICIFCDLENSIKADTGKTPVPGGAVHPLTRYTINYLKYACEYRNTLEQIFKEHAKIERADSTSRPHFEGEEAPNYNPSAADTQSLFSVELKKVMQLLDSNLEAKSKLYKDIALSSIFMMNNGRYILQKIKGPAEIHELVGDNWYRKRSSDLRQYHKSYQRETWGRLLGCLNHEGLTVHGKVVKPVLKEKFKAFNTLFEEIHKTQSSWIISDKQLQSELRVSISAVMIPAYRSFLARFSQYLDPGRQTEKYIKLQPEDIETYIDDLFDGTPTSMARKRS